MRLWDATSGQELAVLRGHERIVYSVAFSPDGTRIASGSGDSTIRLWDSVTYRDRARQRDEARQAADTMEPVVGQLFDQGLAPADIAARLRSDPNLGEPLRRAGLKVLLRRCSAIRAQNAEGGAENRRD